MDIKIFVCCHKEFKVLDNPYLYPIQVGAYFNKPIKGFINDFAGGGVCNISAKNKKYCELTAQYFVWKNVEADYYGFFHYRRYLSFSQNQYKTKITKEVVAEDFGGDFVEKFGYGQLAKTVRDYDILLPEQSYAPLNIRKHYKLSCMQDVRDLDFCVDYIKKHFPEMTKATKKYLKQRKGYFCNMFIMKKDLFHAYCNWLFEILEAHEKFNDHENSDVQTYRVSGYLAERLLGIYITYLKQLNKYKIKELQIIKIENTEIKQALKPECEKVIVVPCDDTSYLKASVLLESIKANIKQPTEVILAHSNLKPQILKLLLSQADDKVRIKSLNLPKNIANYTQFLSNLPYLLENYQKVAVVKPYAIFLNEPSISLTKTIAGAKDIDQEIEIKKYPRRNMKPCVSFNRLEIDLQKFKAVKNFDFLPQEELQLLSQNKMLKFDSLGLKCKEVNAYCAHGLYEEYMAARKQPELVSFEGKVGPLKDQTCEYGDKFFKYAKTSPLYEEIVKTYIASKLTKEEKRFIKKRKRLDKFAPLGSDKRLALRTLSRKFY